jgi:hypothetical protein
MSLFYPSAPKFHDLPAPDATLLVRFYDSVQAISDILDDYAVGEWLKDANAWLGLVHATKNSLSIGEQAVRRFCPEQRYNEAVPASGTLLDQSARAIGLFERTLAAHLKRHGAS